MPTINLPADGAGPQPWLSICLQCVMAFPDDAELRESARSTLILRSMLGEVTEATVGKIMVSPDMLRAALNGPGTTGIRKQMQAATLHGMVSGRIALHLLEMVRDGKRPTLMACFKMLEGDLKRYRTYGEPGRDRSLSTTRSYENAWRRFGAVAHFWAAACLVLEQVGPEGFEATMARDTRRVMAVGMDILGRLADISSAAGNADGPLVDIGSAWVLPKGLDLPPAR